MDRLSASCETTFFDVCFATVFCRSRVYFGEVFGGFWKEFGRKTGDANPKTPENPKFLIFCYFSGKFKEKQRVSFQRLGSVFCTHPGVFGGILADEGRAGEPVDRGMSLCPFMRPTPL